MFGWILKGAGLLKNGWGLLASYRLWVGLAAAGIVLITLLVFYGNCRANAVALESANKLIDDLQIDLKDARVELIARNGRIRSLNTQRLDELAAAEALLRESVRIARQLQAERDEARIDLEVTRFELLEAIQKDEDFNDWANEPVPVTGWSLLQQAATTRR
jgi:hypothetical protein